MSTHNARSNRKSKKTKKTQKTRRQGSKQQPGQKRKRQGIKGMKRMTERGNKTVGQARRKPAIQTNHTIQNLLCTLQRSCGHRSTAVFFKSHGMFYVVNV